MAAINRTGIEPRRSERVRAVRQRPIDRSLQKRFNISQVQVVLSNLTQRDIQRIKKSTCEFFFIFHVFGYAIRKHQFVKLKSFQLIFSC